MRDIDPGTIIITGRPRTGKTTLLRQLVAHPSKRIIRFMDAAGEHFRIDWSEMGMVGYDDIDMGDANIRLRIRKWEEEALGGTARMVLSLRSEAEMQKASSWLRRPPLVMETCGPGRQALLHYKGSAMSSPCVGVALQ